MSRRLPTAPEGAEADPSGPAAAAVVLPALAGALASVVVIGFRPDEVFVYLRVVQNVLDGQGWGFNPGEPVHVASSALWLLVLLVAGKIFGVSPEAAQLASGFASAAGIAGVACLSGRLVGDRRAAWAAGLAMAGDAWMGRWFWSGIETGLGVAVASWALALRSEASPGAGRDRLAGGLLALCPLIRIELLLLPLAAVAASLSESPRRNRARLLWDASALLAVGLVWSAWATTAWGSVVPRALEGAATATAAAGGATEALGRVLFVLLSTQALALTAAAVVGVRWSGRRAPVSEVAPGRREIVRTIIAFALLSAFTFAARRVTIDSRDLLPLAGLIVALGMAGAVSWSRRARSAGAAVGWIAIVAVTLGGNALLSSMLVVPKTRAYARSMQDVVYPLAERLARETGPDATIAVAEIGAIGFLTGRRIVDLSGKATPDVLPYKHAGAIEAYVRQHPPDVLIGVALAPRPWAGRLDGLPIREKGVFRFEGMSVLGPELRASWIENLGDLARLDPVYITVYAIVPPEAPEGERIAVRSAAGTPGL